MKKKLKYASYKNSAFQSLVRIKGNQLKWLNENKKNEGCKTMAGFLDIIINTKEINFNDNKARQLKQILEKELKQFLVLTYKQQIEII